MSSERTTPAHAVRRLLGSAATGVLLLAAASAATVGNRGIWRLADYPFDSPEFWPQALNLGRALAELADAPAPRWAVVGSSTVLYDVIPDALTGTPRREEDGRPHIVELAVQQAIFTDIAALTQAAHHEAPLDLALIGVHPRDFDVSVDPRATLVARTFDHAAIDVAALQGGSPARRFERAVAAAWPAFRIRRLQTRVLHAFLPDPTLLDAGEDGPQGEPRTGPLFDPEDAPTTDNGQFTALLAWIDWCRMEGVRPVVVYFPVRTGDPGALWPRAHGDTWLAVLQTELGARGVPFINARDAAPPTAFFDFNHLHEQGAIAFSAWLGRQLWVALEATP